MRPNIVVKNKIDSTIINNFPIGLPLILLLRDIPFLIINLTILRYTNIIHNTNVKLYLGITFKI